MSRRPTDDTIAQNAGTCHAWHSLRSDDTPADPPAKWNSPNVRGISADIKALEGDILKLLKEVTHER